MSILCPKCSEKLLYQFGYPFQVFYENILNLSVNYETLIFHEKLCPSEVRTITKFIESKGMITTTEVSKNEVCVFVNYDKLYYANNNEHLCLELDEHYSNNT